MKVIDYNSVMGFSVEKLETETQQAIREGWQPWGSPYVFEDKLFQAVVKYDDDTTPTPAAQSQYDRQAELDRRVMARLAEYDQYWNEEAQLYQIPNDDNDPQGEYDWQPNRDELMADIQKGVELELNSESKS